VEGGGNGLKRSIETKFWIGDIVYQKVAADESPGMITAVRLGPSGSVGYSVSQEHGDGFYFEVELTDVFLPDYAKEKEGGE
jgi:hypothetical protein